MWQPFYIVHTRNIGIDFTRLYITNMHNDFETFTKYRNTCKSCTKGLILHFARHFKFNTNAILEVFT